MSLLVYVFFALLAGYGLILLWLAAGFLRSSAPGNAEYDPKLPLTIIICARNEEKHITRCLNSILQQAYAREKIQLLLINDASTDSTVQRAEQVLKPSGINYRIISNPQRKGKKQSITYAMQFAANELIVLRDADTFTVSPLWLQSISGFYQSTRADLVTGPVAIANNSGLLWALQAIENNVLSVIACGSAFYGQAFLCSGANLAFTRKIFETVNGYTSHIHIPSGDDVLFMEDVKKIKGARIAYLKSRDSLVYTYPVFSFRDLLMQKTRWASKFKVNSNKLNAALAFLSFAVNFAWLFCFMYVNKLGMREAFLLFIFLKLFIDILLLFLASGFIKNRQLLWFSLPVSFVYPVYACVIGIASLFVKPRWK